jgi:hypothetical protein
MLLCGCATLLCFVAVAGGRAQGQEIDEVKGKIFDAHMAQQTFGGLKYCNELNGTSFYFSCATAFSVWKNISIRWKVW